MTRSQSRTVLVRVREALPELRPSEKRIADLLLKEPARVAEMSIAVLARECTTSTTSVVRFYKRIGYERFQDLRLDIAREVTREFLEHNEQTPLTGDVSPTDSLKDIVKKVATSETLSIADTADVLRLDHLQEAVELAANARRIDIFGIGASAFVGLDLQQKLTRIGLTALNWTDSHAAWTSAVTLDQNCLAIAISHSGSTPDTIEYLRLAQSVGARTVGITNFRNSPFGRLSDVVLTTAARETTFRSGALGSRIAQLMIIDCLFIGIAQSAYEKSMSALRDTYEAVHKPRK